MELLQLLQSPGALPSIPRVVALVLSELDSDEPDLRKIGMQLKEDPILTARLLAVANSARFNLSRGVTSVAEALPLLGLNELRDMIYAAAVASAFRQSAPRVTARCRPVRSSRFLDGRSHAIHLRRLRL